MFGQAALFDKAMGSSEKRSSSYKFLNYIDLGDREGAIELLSNKGDSVLVDSAILLSKQLNVNPERVSIPFFLDENSLGQFYYERNYFLKIEENKMPDLQLRILSSSNGLVGNIEIRQIRGTIPRFAEINEIIENRKKEVPEPPLFLPPKR